MVLEKLKDAASDKIGREVTRCVVTVPAYFNDVQRRATEEACRIAGLECVKLLDEPVAAAIAHGYHI